MIGFALDKWWDCEVADLAKVEKANIESKQRAGRALLLKLRLIAMIDAYFRRLNDGPSG